MLVSEFSDDFLDLAYAQFAIGIVLSQLNESAASKAVIAFKSTYADGSISEEQTARLVDERNKLEENFLKTGKNVITGLLEVLQTKEVLPVFDKSGYYKKKVMVSLGDLLIDKNCVKKIYRNTMELLRKFSKYELIAVYIDTAEFKETFKRDILRKYSYSADRFRMNDVSDSIVDEIRDDFKREIRANSCNGSYSPISGTPTAFLRNAFNMFYSRSGNIQRIFNTRGTNADAGGESDMTTIDFYTLNPTSSAAAFDFIDVANRINRASYLLFDHNGNDVAFFDILSCYREEKIRERMRQDKRHFDTFLKGCEVKFVDSSSNLNCGNENTINNKKSSRIELCKLFSPIVDKGLSQSELFSYYRKALALTNATDNHDGRRLFTYVDYETGVISGATNHVENNSQMFQIIVSGHLALRELVEYLDKNRAVASIYNFPTIIFRNKDYLRRFQTIEEYVSYIQDVSPLVEQVRNDSVRRKEFLDGFACNDQVWKYLGDNNLMYDNLFTKLISMPLSFIKSAVNDSKVLSKDTEFEQRYSFLLQTLKNLSERVETFTESGNLLECYSNIEKVYLTVRDASFSEKSKLFQYSIVLSFYKTLCHTLSLEQKFICDSNGYYLFEESNVVEEFQKVSGGMQKLISENPKFAEVYKKQVICRAVAISKVYSFITGVEVSTVCDWKQFREFFCVCELLCGLLRRLYENGVLKVHKAVRQYEDFSFLIISKMAEDREIFEMPSVISSCDELTFLYKDPEIHELYINKLRSNSECLSINEERNRRLVPAVNRFLSSFGEDLNAFSLGMALLDKYVSERHTTVNFETDVDVVLHEAARKAYGFNNALRVDAKIKNWLSGIAEHDDDGYVLRDERRCDLYDNDTFVLSNGFLVKLNPDQRGYSYSIMTEKDVVQLSHKLALGGV